MYGYGSIFEIHVRNNNWYGLIFEIDVRKRNWYGSISECMCVKRNWYGSISKSVYGYGFRTRLRIPESAVNSKVVCILQSPGENKHARTEERTLLLLTIFVKVQVTEKIITPVQHKKRLLAK